MGCYVRRAVRVPVSRFISVFPAAQIVAALSERRLEFLHFKHHPGAERARPSSCEEGSRQNSPPDSGGATALAVGVVTTGRGTLLSPKGRNSSRRSPSPDRRPETTATSRYKRTPRPCGRGL